MKLRRLVSALVVFVMIMACAVCVSADITPSVYTIYDATNSNVSIQANVTGTTSGDMVTYIVYGGSGDTVPTTANIKYIDQITATGTDVEFPLVTGTKADLDGKLVKFGTSNSAGIASNDNSVAETATKWMKKDSITIDTTNRSIVFFLYANKALVTGNAGDKAGIDVTLKADGKDNLVLESLDIIGVDANSGKCAVEVKLGDDTAMADYLVYFTGATESTIEIAPYYYNGVNKVYLESGIVDNYWVK